VSVELIVKVQNMPLKRSYSNFRKQNYREEAEMVGNSDLVEAVAADTVAVVVMVVCK